MDVIVSVSFFQDELASTIEHAVKAAVDTVLCQITKVVGGKFTEFRMEMAGKEKENESLKLRLEISESELKAVRECMNAADADIKQPLRNMNPDCNEQDFQRNENQGLFQDPKESRAVPKSEAQEGPRIEAVYTQEESFDQEWCASLKQVTELTFVKDEEVPRLECVPIKEEFIEQECVPIAEEVPTENNVCTLEENNQLGSSLCDDCPPECELGFRAFIVDEGEHDSTPSLHCKNSSSGKPQSRKHSETTPQEEHFKTMRVQIPSVQDKQLLTLESIETAYSVCVNNSETRGNLKTLSCSTEDGKSSWQLGSPKTHKGNHTGGTPFSCAEFRNNFSRLSHLKRQRRNHIGEKLHHCNECEKSFSQLQHLKNHIRIHTGEKPYHCNVCGKRFTELGTLKRHKRIHTGEKPHHCNECGRSFTRAEGLRKHLRIHRRETIPLYVSLNVGNSLSGGNS
ncbi:zinc finger protein 16-like [Acipenser ruthenus]|uniref:zinc finger protein 16-like n=1 Tax=Acipenser ruthenus TaxID=7906 RepID=UPI002741405F|nr:zinc finger protein 16-like [Acipenser ruthenus]